MESSNFMLFIAPCVFRQILPGLIFTSLMALMVYIAYVLGKEKAAKRKRLEAVSSNPIPPVQEKKQSEKVPQSGNNNTGDRSKTQAPLIRNLPVVCTAINHGYSLPATMDVNLTGICFNDGTGKCVNIDEVKAYIVQGDHLQFLGIANGSVALSLTEPQEFPYIGAFKKDEHHKTHMDLCCVWYRGSLDVDLNVVYDSIKSNPWFSKLDRQWGFKGIDWMFEDLAGAQLERFKNDATKQNSGWSRVCEDVMFTTCYDKEADAVRFLLYPSSTLDGIVDSSYKLDAGDNKDRVKRSNKK